MAPRGDRRDASDKQSNARKDGADCLDGYRPVTSARVCIMTLLRVPPPTTRSAPSTPPAHSPPPPPPPPGRAPSRIAREWQTPSITCSRSHDLSPPALTPLAPPAPKPLARQEQDYQQHSARARRFARCLRRFARCLRGRGREGCVPGCAVSSGVGGGGQCLDAREGQECSLCGRGRRAVCGRGGRQARTARWRSALEVPEWIPRKQARACHPPAGSPVSQASQESRGNKPHGLSTSRCARAATPCPCPPRGSSTCCGRCGVTHFQSSGGTGHEDGSAAQGSRVRSGEAPSRRGPGSVRPRQLPRTTPRLPPPCSASVRPYINLTSPRREPQRKQSLFARTREQEERGKSLKEAHATWFRV